MADKRCDNGHFIDESWDLCPYCPQERRAGRVLSAPSLAGSTPAASLSRSVADSPAEARPAAPRVVDLGAAIPDAGPQRTTVAPRAVAEPAEATSRYVVGWLLGLTGAQRGEAFPVRMGRNIIGRSSKSDIVIHDEQASGHHADLVFRPEEKRFILMDHNSTNGTYVNGEEISPRCDLAPRAIIRIGKQRFVFVPLVGETFDWNDGALR